MKKSIVLGLLFCLMTLLTGCSSKEHKYVGTFTDEFGNKFELRDDYTATITFVGCDPQETGWSDGDKHDMPYATIAFNGDPAYYYLRDGMLYRHREHMIDGTMAIKIEWE